MEIAIVGSARTTISPPFAGGLEMHTHVLAEGLTDRGHNVTVFAADGHGRFDIERLRPIVRDPSDNSRRDLCTHEVAERSEHESYADAVRTLTRADYDVVHLNTIHYLPFELSASLPGAVTGTLHSPPYPRIADAIRAAVVSKKPMSVASISHTNAAAWQHEAILDRVIVNGVNVQHWPFGGGGGGAVWTGRVVREKAPHLAIQAARLAGVGLQLLGPIHDEEYFHREIEPLLGGDIQYAGHAGVAELAEAVGRASVAIVSPMWDEPFGLVIAEALSCGTPVAAFDRGAIPELLDERTGALAVAGDVEDLADAIRRAMGLDRMTCRLYAEHRFSAERMLDEYEHWFVERAGDELQR